MGTVDLTLETRPSSGLPQAVEVVARGQMSSTTVATFKARIDAAVAGPTSIVLLGLKDVPFLPSITLSYLADLVVRLQRRGGGILLVQADSKVKLVLASLGLVQFFQFFDEFDAARACARGLAQQLRQQPRLLIARGPGEGQEYPIGDEPVTIGSAPEATIRVTASSIAPCHAEVCRSEDRVVVCDKGSKMGTFVGKKKVSSQALAHGDVIRIADLELRFLGPGEI